MNNDKKPQFGSADRLGLFFLAIFLGVATLFSLAGLFLKGCPSGDSDRAHIFLIAAGPVAYFSVAMTALLHFLTGGRRKS